MGLWNLLLLPSCFRWRGPQPELVCEHILTVDQAFTIEGLRHAKAGSSCPSSASAFHSVHLLVLKQLSFPSAAYSAIQSLSLCSPGPPTDAKQAIPTLGAAACLWPWTTFPTRGSSNLKGMSLLLERNRDGECFQSTLHPFMPVVLCLAEVDGSTQP